MSEFFTGNSKKLEKKPPSEQNFLWNRTVFLAAIAIITFAISRKDPTGIDIQTRVQAVDTVTNDSISAQVIQGKTSLGDIQVTTGHSKQLLPGLQLAPSDPLSEENIGQDLAVAIDDPDPKETNLLEIVGQFIRLKSYLWLADFPTNRDWFEYVYHCSKSDSCPLAIRTTWSTETFWREYDYEPDPVTGKRNMPEFDIPINPITELDLLVLEHHGILMVTIPSTSSAGELIPGSSGSAFVARGDRLLGVYHGSLDDLNYRITTLLFRSLLVYLKDLKRIQSPDEKYQFLRDKIEKWGLHSSINKVYLRSLYYIKDFGLLDEFIKLLEQYEVTQNSSIISNFQIKLIDAHIQYFVNKYPHGLGKYFSAKRGQMIQEILNGDTLQIIVPLTKENMHRLRLQNIF